MNINDYVIYNNIQCKVLEIGEYIEIDYNGESILVLERDLTSNNLIYDIGRNLLGYLIGGISTIRYRSLYNEEYITSNYFNISNFVEENLAKHPTANDSYFYCIDGIMHCGFASSNIRYFYNMYPAEMDYLISTNSFDKIIKLVVNILNEL